MREGLYALIRRQGTPNEASEQPVGSSFACGCGRTADLRLARTPMCRFCFLAEADRIARETALRARRDAARDRAMSSPPFGHDARLRAVWCPLHERVWRGFVGEVHGVHDAQHWACNRRAVPVPEGVR